MFLKFENVIMLSQPQVATCVSLLQELKGNIRVFCRVRPISASEQSSTDHDSMPAVEFPPVTDVLGAGIVLQVRTPTLNKTWLDSNDESAVFTSIVLRSIYKRQCRPWTCLQAPVRNNAMDTLIAPTKHTFNFDKVCAGVVLLHLPVSGPGHAFCLCVACVYHQVLAAKENSAWQGRHDSAAEAAPSTHARKNLQNASPHCICLLI